MTKKKNILKLVFLWMFFVIFPTFLEAQNFKSRSWKEISLEEANAIRESIVSQIPLAADKEFCLEVYGDSLQEVFSRFKKNEGGVWCAGAANILTKVYLSKGVRAFTLSYGFIKEGLLTHAVTVVKTKKGWFIQDPYFNLFYEGEFCEVLSDLSKRRIPQIWSAQSFRMVHFKSLEDYSSSKKFDSKCEEPKIIKVKDDHFCVELSLNFYKFELFHNQVDETKRLLIKKGLPADISFIMLYPYGVYDGERYLSVSGYGGVFSYFGISNSSCCFD